MKLTKLIKMTVLKKLALSVLIALYLFTSLAVYVPKSSYALQPWYNQHPDQFYSKVFDDPSGEIFGERYTYAQVNWIIWSVIGWPFAQVLGADVMRCISSSDVGNCLKLAQAPSQEPFTNLQSDKSLVASVFNTNRSLSALSYLDKTINKFSIIPEANAQEGFGYKTALDPIQTLWKASRDLSYVLFVIIIIIFAFMIMFRIKISPQTVVSIQSALPKIFIALILVTFSYAIAGLLIDLMYVVIGLLSLLLSSFVRSFSGNQSNPAYLFEVMTQGPGFGSSSNPTFHSGIFGLIIIFLVLATFVGLLLVIVFFGAIGAALATAVATLLVIAAASAAPTTAIALIIGLVFLLIIMAVIVIYLVKIVWGLAKAYATIVLLTIFAPFLITLGVVIPSLGFGNWVKQYSSNLAVFVVTGFLFVLSFIFLGMSAQYAKLAIGSAGVDPIGAFIFGVPLTNVFTGQDFVPGWPPLLYSEGETGIALLFFIVSLVIFLIIHRSNELVKAIISGQSFNYGAAIGQAVGPADTLTRGATSLGVSRMERFGPHWLGNLLRTIRYIR